jgi:hypothetical protein
MILCRFVSDSGVKLGKQSDLGANETTKVSRVQGPIFLIFVVPCSSQTDN